jgi:uncharacterized protein YPO0396
MTNASIRENSLIYSGIFNSRTGVNNTNQFSVGEDITKSLIHLMDLYRNYMLKILT